MKAMKLISILLLSILMVGCGKDTEKIRSFKKDIYESYVCSYYMISQIIQAGSDYQDGKHFMYADECVMVNLEQVDLTTARMEEGAYEKMPFKELLDFTHQTYQIKEKGNDGLLQNCIYCNSTEAAMEYVKYAINLYKLPKLCNQMIYDAKKELPTGEEYNQLAELASYAERLYQYAISTDMTYQDLYSQSRLVAQQFNKAFDKSDDLFPNTNINKVEAQELAEKQISIYIQTNREKAMSK